MSDFLKKYKNALALYGGLALGFIVLVMLAVIPQKGTPYNPTAISIGSLEVQWYAIFILFGITFAAILAYFEMKNKKIDTEILFDGLILTVIPAIIGARLWYVLFNLDQIKSFMDIFAVWEGGLAIHGAIIVTFILLIFFCRKKKLSYWFLLDLVAPGFLIGQTLGRWGNFMNQELYGPVANNLNFLPGFIKDQMLIGNKYYHPTFLYESIWNFVGLVFILIIRRYKVFKLGDHLSFYLVWYGIGRIITETLRLQSGVNEPLMILGIPVSLAVSILFIIAGILVFTLKRLYAKELPYYQEFMGNFEVTK